MSVKYHDVNPLGPGMKHVSVGIELKRLNTTVTLDIQCPDELADAFAKALISLIEKESKKHA